MLVKPRSRINLDSSGRTTVLRPMNNYQIVGKRGGPRVRLACGHPFLGKVFGDQRFVDFVGFSLHNGLQPAILLHQIFGKRGQA